MDSFDNNRIEIPRNAAFLRTQQSNFAYQDDDIPNTMKIRTILKQTQNRRGELGRKFNLNVDSAFQSQE